MLCFVVLGLFVTWVWESIYRLSPAQFSIYRAGYTLTLLSVVGATQIRDMKLRLVAVRSLLVATIFLFLALARYHELTAMKAAGMSLYRVAAPILLLGSGVAILSGLFQELLLPRLNELGDEVDRVKIRGQQHVIC